MDSRVRTVLSGEGFDGLTLIDCALRVSAFRRVGPFSGCLWKSFLPTCIHPIYCLRQGEMELLTHLQVTLEWLDISCEIADYFRRMMRINTHVLANSSWKKFIAVIEWVSEWRMMMWRLVASKWCDHENVTTCDVRDLFIGEFVAVFGCFIGLDQSIRIADQVRVMWSFMLVLRAMARGHRDRWASVEVLRCDGWRGFFTSCGRRIYTWINSVQSFEVNIFNATLLPYCG